MRYLVLVLACGCTVVEPFAASDPDESEVSLSLIEACPTGQWCIETPPAEVATTKLHGVWAIDEDDVFAVGNGGTILRRVNGNDWFAMSSGTTTNLTTVWGSSSSDVWVGSTSSLVLHYDGTSWSQISAPISNVDSIWGSSSSSVWFIGSGVTMHWDGSSFTATSGTTTLLSVSGTGANDAWIGGANIYLRHYNGTAWLTSMPQLSGSTYRAVFARTPTDAWAAGVVPKYETTHWDGAKWTPYKTDVRGAFMISISGQSANDVWAVGSGRVAHWTGGPSWSTELPFGSNVSLWAITTVPGHAWIVGNDGLIAHRAL